MPRPSLQFVTSKLLQKGNYYLIPTCACIKKTCEFNFSLLFCRDRKPEPSSETLYLCSDTGSKASINAEVNKLNVTIILAYMLLYLLQVKLFLQ